MTLGSIQTPDCKTLSKKDKSLIVCHSTSLIIRSYKLKSLF
ncbi:hypothetical protein BACCOP_04030 [Phocaeicola coprocola DSM 17136]|uniref:Uncharacterized protein n=1 Tax=Phocaeicola coprocola DSM 17136 TaxID=470145 RepID=B3JPZ8_9BACT|nr:hypothetical protein BACCOP_04030 [Phocaeicola coprocola DSM 17136]